MVNGYFWAGVGVKHLIVLIKYNNDRKNAHCKLLILNESLSFWHCVLTISKKRPFHFSADSDNNLIPASQIVHFNCHNRKKHANCPQGFYCRSNKCIVHRLGKNKRMKEPCIIFVIFAQRKRFLSDPGKPGSRWSYKIFCRLNWCDSGRYQLNTN